MSALSVGLATFNSCNKKGAIPYFTEYLKTKPNDYTALMWRGRAYQVINDLPLAKQDFAAAANVSSGSRKLIALAKQCFAEENTEGGKHYLELARHQEPNSAEVWAATGIFHYNNGSKTDARPFLEKSAHLFETNRQTYDPLYCWTKYLLGDVYLFGGEIDKAFKEFTEAVTASETLTVAHLGIAKVYLLKGDSQAKRLYIKARELNPTLVHWSTFESFRDDFFAGEGKTVKAAIDAQRMEESKWKQMQKDSKWIMEYGGRYYVLSSCGKKWYTRNLGIGHAGAFVKVYDDKGSIIQFNGSCDRDLVPIKNKNESMAGTSINKSDMRTVIRR